MSRVALSPGNIHVHVPYWMDNHPISLDIGRTRMMSQIHKMSLVSVIMCILGWIHVYTAPPIVVGVVNGGDAMTAF